MVHFGERGIGGRNERYSRLLDNVGSRLLDNVVSLPIKHVKVGGGSIVQELCKSRGSRPI